MDVVEGCDDKGEVDTNVDNDEDADENDKGEDDGENTNGDGVKNDLGEGEKMDDGEGVDLGEGEKIDDGEGVDFFLFGNGSTPPDLVELYKTKEVQTTLRPNISSDFLRV